MQAWVFLGWKSPALLLQETFFSWIQLEWHGQQLDEQEVYKVTLVWALLTWLECWMLVSSSIRAMIALYSLFPFLVSQSKACRSIMVEMVCYRTHARVRQTSKKQPGLRIWCNWRVKSSAFWWQRQRPSANGAERLHWQTAHVVIYRLSRSQTLSQSALWELGKTNLFTSGIGSHAYNTR